VVARTLLAPCSTLPRPRTSTLFPYTTLFRSAPEWVIVVDNGDDARVRTVVQSADASADGGPRTIYLGSKTNLGGAGGFAYGMLRSEEHTSELQSRFDLVCRLLLEKKKPENSF